MKKAWSVLLGAAAAFALTAFSAAAEDITIEPSFAVETSDGVSYTVDSNKLAATQLKEDSTLTVSCTGGSSEECPFKLILNYWNSDSDANNGMGEPASAEVRISEYKDGKAVYKYEDITAALNGADPAKAYSFDITAASGEAVKFEGLEAKNVYSAAEAAEKGLLHTVHVHANNPVTAENWKQSLTVGVDLFDTSTLTPRSLAIAFFESEITEESFDPPVEMIFQSTDDKISPKAKNGTVWAKIRAAKFSPTFAIFAYDTMTEAYGTDDFSCVSTVYIGDTGVSPITCTDLYVLGCKTLPPAAEEEPEESSEAEKPAETVSSAAESAAEEVSSAAEPVAAAAAETDTSSAAEKSSVSSNIIFIIIGVAAGIIIAVVVVIIILNRKASIAYDVNTHKYIKK